MTDKERLWAEHPKAPSAVLEYRCRTKEHPYERYEQARPATRPYRPLTAENFGEALHANEAVYAGPYGRRCVSISILGR
jgi:hypothetical protein